MSNLTDTGLTAAQPTRLVEVSMRHQFNSATRFPKLLFIGLEVFVIGIVVRPSGASDNFSGIAFTAPLPFCAHVGRRIIGEQSWNVHKVGIGDDLINPLLFLTRGFVPNDRADFAWECLF